MDTDRDTARIVRSWLEEGRTRLPDHVLDAVLDQIPATPQRRRVWLARRLPHMRMPIRLAATAAIVVALVAGVGPLTGGLDRGVGGVGPAVTASPSPSPSPSPIPVPVIGTSVPLHEGARYVTPDPFPIRITFTAPAGWLGHVGGPYAVWLANAASEDTIWFQRFDTVYADPCHADKGPLVPAPGPSVDDLATALSTLPGLTVTKPTDTTFAGYTGKQLTLTAPDNLADCTGGFDAVWLLPLGASNDMTAGESIRVWILDVAGQRLVISAVKLPQFSSSELATIQAVLDSIRIDASN